MAKVNLKSILVDYAKYRKKRDEIENRVMAINYETCRQNLNEAIYSLGLESKYFKENFVSNQSFQFDEQDKELIFQIFDRFTTNEFVLVRKGAFLEVPLDTVEFYINAFTTILKHLEVDEEIVEAQRASMLKYTQYSLAVEYNKACQELAQIGQDIEKIIRFDNRLDCDDDSVFFQHVYEKLSLIKKYIRHVHMNMAEHRERQEGLMAEIKALKPLLEKDREGVKEKLVNKVKLDQALRQNTRYLELEDLMANCVENKTFMKHKVKEFVEIEKEMVEISRETQMNLFGRIIDNESLFPEKIEVEKMPSRDLLEMAVKQYIDFHAYKKSLKDDEPLIGDIMCDQLFED